MDNLLIPTTNIDLQILFGVLAFFLLVLSYAISLKRNISALAKENEQYISEISQTPIEIQLDRINQSISKLNDNLAAGKNIFSNLQKEYLPINIKINKIDLGLYPPVFNFDDSENLKENIFKCRNEQLDLITKGGAIRSLNELDWLGDKQAGAAVLNAYRRLMLLAFNAEFDSIRKQMRHSTFDTAMKKLNKLDDRLFSLGETVLCGVTPEYLNLKSNELSVWHKELQHKEEVKQGRKKEKEVLRQQNKVVTNDTEDLENEIDFNKADLKKAQLYAQELAESDRLKIQREIEEINIKIKELESRYQRELSQAQVTRAGYIYVISNIGSFGEGVVKIGMTRRLEPMDRVRELGDASVPFKFDVHTLQYVDDAPKVEKELHQKFNPKRVNIENNRKEFFRVSPEEVKLVMDEMKISSDWYFEVEAKEYYESELIRESMLKSKTLRKHSVLDVFPNTI